MNDEEFAEYRSQLTRNVRTKIAQCPDEGCDCILWTGALDSSGYASFKIRAVVTIAHRYAYEKLVGPIEVACAACGGEPIHMDTGAECFDCDGTGLDPDPTVDHLCIGHRNCMNVNHMEIVSRSENSIRANTRKKTGYRRTDQ